MGRKNRRAGQSDNAGDTQPWYARLDPRILAGARYITTRAGIVLAGVVVVMVGMRLLERYVERLPAYERPLTLQWAHLPDWLKAPANAHVLDEVTEAVGLTLADRMLDRDLARRIGERLSAPHLAWVERVERVEVQSGGIVSISARFRRPTAWVRRGDWCYLLSADGVRLNGRYSFRSTVGSTMIVIDGVHGPVPAVGECWDVPEVRAGLKMVQACNGRRFRDQIERVVVSRDERRDSGTVQIEIRTDRPGTRIWWGREPGMEDGCEISALQKLALLDSLHRRSGRVDMGRDYVNVTTWPDRVSLQTALGPQALGATRRR